VLCAGVLLAPACTADGPPKPWNYVALGDSFGTGLGASESYPTVFGRYIEQDTGNRVLVDNRSINGQASDGLLAAIFDDDDLRDTIAGAEVITMNIGLNDMADDRLRFLAGDCGGDDNQQCLRDMVDHLAENWEAIITEIVNLRSPDEAIVRVLSSYYPYVDDDYLNAVTWVMTPLLLDMYERLETLAVRYRVGYADAHRGFNGPDGILDPIASGLLDPATDHPSIAGQILTASVLRSLGYEPLAPP
jgi:lysophospholipase L1-like esterase